MAGRVVIDKIQLGDNATATKNFFIEVPDTPDGTCTLYRGNVGTLTNPVFKVQAAASGDGMAVKGTGTNDAAAAGFVGEYVESVVGAANTAANSTVYDVTSISLTAGDWDVSGMVDYISSSSTWTSVRAGISTTTGDFSTGLVSGSNVFLASWGSSSTTPTEHSVWVPCYRMSLTTTTTVYLKGMVAFSGGQPTIRGARLSARRVR